MAKSLSKILIHTVFSTKDPALPGKQSREELHRYLGRISANHGCQPIIVGGFEDHVDNPLDALRNMVDGFTRIVYGYDVRR